MSKNTGTSELINYFDLGANGDVGIAGSLDVNTIANATTDTDKFLVSDTGIIKYRTGAELLSDIGAAPATGGSYLPLAGGTLTGALNGTSASFNSNVDVINYTTGSSLFVGGLATNGVSNGIILLQSGRVPQSGSDTTGTNGLLFQHTISNATNVNGGYIYNGRETVFSSASVVNTFTAFATTLANTNNERMRITSGGNIGIGAIVPLSSLDVRGSGNTVLNSSGNLFVSSGGTPSQLTETGGQISFGAWLDGDLTKPYPVGVIKGISESSTINVNGGALIFATMNSSTTAVERIRINSLGNLLVGTTTDAGFKLQVNGEGRFYQSATNTTAYLRVENNRARNAALRLTTTVGDYLLGVGIGADVNQFQIYDNTAGTTRLTIASTGAATFSSSVTSDGLFRSNQGILQIFAAGGFRGGVYNYASWLGSGTDYSPTLASETNIYFATAGSITRQMTITSGGNVLIGTTTDNGAKLQVSGTSTITGQMQQGFNQLRSSTGTQGVSTTADIFRFLNVSGGINNGYYSAIFHVWVYDNNTGANSFSATYAVQTTSNGQTNAAFTQLASVVRGTNPVSSINLISDGGGGAAKISLTTTATPTSGVTYQCSAIGIF